MNKNNNQELIKLLKEESELLTKRISNISSTNRLTFIENTLATINITIQFLQVDEIQKYSNDLFNKYNYSQLTELMHLLIINMGNEYKDNFNEKDFKNLLETLYKLKKY